MKGFMGQMPYLSANQHQQSTTWTADHACFV